MSKSRNYFDLFKEFFITDFKLRYKHSILGFLWVVIKPLSLFTILFIVWSSLFKTQGNFALSLLLGVIMINFFTEGINFGLQSLFNKAHIILKINFPREIVVLSSIAIAIVNFFINLLIFLGFSIFFPLNLNLEGLILVVIAILSLILIILAISLFLSILSIKLHDIRHIVELILQLAFWATPVLYNIDILPENVSGLVLLNPLTHILQFLRQGFLDSSVINSQIISKSLILLLISILFTVLGVIFFKLRIRKIAQYF